MKVKICANTSIEEAQMCIDAGADIIGILVGQEHASNDFVDKEKAKEKKKKLPFKRSMSNIAFALRQVWEVSPAYFIIYYLMSRIIVFKEFVNRSLQDF